MKREKERERGAKGGGATYFAGAKGKDSLETCGISRGSLYPLVSRDAAGSIACQRRREAGGCGGGVGGGGGSTTSLF